MKYNQLIKGSPAVSEIGLGAWQLGIRSGWKEMSEAEAITLVQTAHEMGVNFFDTAPNYGRGTSEQRLGKALQGYDRSKLVINTKFGHTDTGVTNYYSSNIRSSLEGSLKRLQTDYVDSLIIHSPPSVYLDGNNNDHYEVLEQLKTEGKIKAYGASLDTYRDIETLLRTTQSQVIEVFFNILHQDAARAFELAKEKGVGIIVKIPLDSGWLTGKYDEHSVFTDIRKRWSASDIHTRAALVRRVKTIIGPGASLAHTALSFCLAYDTVSTIIPGNTSLQQLTENLSACSIPLSRELVKQLETFYEQEVRGMHIPW
jgi:aryl-alcohol dehydrogenase-like predicted oxidoreductase